MNKPTEQQIETDVAVIQELIDGTDWRERTTSPKNANQAKQRCKAAWARIRDRVDSAETAIWHSHANIERATALEAALAAEKARADAAEAERDRLEKMVNDLSVQAADEMRAVASLTEQLAEAREALEPFARWKIADGLPNGMLRTPDQHPILIGTEHMVVAGDFRRARATLSRLEKQEGEK